MLLVNVNDAADTVASPVSPDVTLITTSEPGSAVNTTVNVSVLPDSATAVEPDDWVTVNPAESLSALAAVTVWLANESKSSSELPSTTARVIVVLILPSMMSSSTPVTVIV